MKPSSKPNPETYSQMQMDIALLKQSYEKIVEPTLKDIVFKLDHLDVIHRNEFEEHKHDGELEAERIFEMLRQHQAQAYKDFNDYKKEIKEEFSKQSKSRFIQNTLAALFGAILAFLSQYAFKDILGG